MIYGRLELPKDLATSPKLVGLDVFASAVGVVVGFFVNEKTTVGDMADLRGRGSRETAVRLLKFQGVYVVGTAITIGVQLALLAAIGLSPAVGNLVGAAVAFPPSYMISLRTVWRV